MTNLAPQYDPSAIEADTYERWLDAGVFGASAESDRTPYVIVIPPPNVTAVLHSGHGLNNTLQDVLIRFERMRGREALWLPGTDHAGIATQNMVERMLDTEGKTRQDLGRAAFVERVWEHVHQTGGTIIDQLKAIGCSCDWSRTRFTLDEAYSFAVRKVFVDLYEDGKIYRGHRVIHWCPRCLTSLSDEEAEFQDSDDHLYYIRYRVTGGQDAANAEAGGAAATAGFVTVATTRPETMFGDVALVFHPEDDRFQQYQGATVEIPLSGVAIPVRTSTVVERDFGTGMLKVTPAHDANDFDIADSLGGFERPVTMDEDATMSAMDRVPAELQGLAMHTIGVPKAVFIFIGCVVQFVGIEGPVVPFLQLNGIHTAPLGRLEHLLGFLHIPLVVVPDFRYDVTAIRVVDRYTFDQYGFHEVPFLFSIIR